MFKEYVSESDFIKLFGLPDEHCDSCHEDAEEGYYDGQMCQPEWDDKYSDVCCVVNQNYKKMKEPRHEK